MKRRHFWLIPLALLALITFVSASRIVENLFLMEQGAIAQSTPAQTSPPAPTSPSPAISPSRSPTVSPTPSGSATEVPSLPTAPVPTPTSSPGNVSPLPPPTLPSASPLPLSGDYQDPSGRFKVGILQGYNVTPLAGSVLVESPDGSVSYTVIFQAQALADLVGYDPISVNSALEQIARTVFQRGEGFQPGLAQPAALEGVQLEWTGTLTIAGKAQPIGGVILARQTGRNALLLLIAATQTGSGQVPGAVAALASSLQAL